MKKTLGYVAAIFVYLCTLEIGAALAQTMGMPEDKVALRYRIEYQDKDKWKPVKDSKKFKKNHTIRFRFMSNTAGTLYVLNNSEENASLLPIFAEGSGAGLRKHLGLGTQIEANQVGIFPRQDKGGGLRFTGVKGKERFLFIFVPDEMGTRAVMAIVPGAENWNFDSKSTNMATGEPSKILFHYFELKSK